MIFEMTFSECGANKNWSIAEIINRAYDYVLENYFSEFDEMDIIPQDLSDAKIDWDNKIIRLPVNPVWLKYTSH